MKYFKELFFLDSMNYTNVKQNILKRVTSKKSKHIRSGYPYISIFMWIDIVYAMPYNLRAIFCNNILYSCCLDSLGT